MKSTIEKLIEIVKEQKQLDIENGIENRRDNVINLLNKMYQEAL